MTATAVDARPPIRWSRIARVLTIALAVAAPLRLAGFLLFVPDAPSEIGLDYRLYIDATQRWLSGGSFYPAWQLAGPYTMTPYAGRGEILYPPAALPLFSVFSYLPAILWWAVPLGVTAYAVWRLRPAWWAQPILAFLLLWPRTQELVILGNPGMWCVAGIAAGVVWAWPAAIVLIKPSLLPFSLVGAGHRSWWIAALVLLASTLPFAGLWLDWLRVVGNTPGGILYSIADVPTMSIGLVAWLASRAPRPRLLPAMAGALVARPLHRFESR